MPLQIETFFHSASSTFSYVVYAGSGTECAVIDAVLDFDPNTSRVSTGSADKIAAFIRSKDLHVQWILETHIHADHLSAAQYLKSTFGGDARIAASKAVELPCKTFQSLFNLDQSESLPGHFDYLFDDLETFCIGKLKARALHVPGHTPADLAYQVDESVVFVGDTLFAPDLGTARCDFPGGSAFQLYRSVHRLLNLPPETRLFLCHDYPAGERSLQNVFTVRQQREENIHINACTSEATFVTMRRTRDAGLSLPSLMIPAIQVNIRAGQLPATEKNGVAYLKIPLNTF